MSFYAEIGGCHFKSKPATRGKFQSIAAELSLGQAGNGLKWAFIDLCFSSTVMILKKNQFPLILMGDITFNYANLTR